MKHRPELDGVRGFACLSVLLLHIVLGPIKTTPGTTFDSIRIAIQPFMVGGVDLFFVLSGFLIGGILLDNKEADNYFIAFWRRRIGRIFPVYYLMLGLVLLIYAIDHFHSSAYTRSALYNQIPWWSMATFTQNFYMVFTGKYGNFLGVTWSLAMEEQFYIVLPFLVYFLARNRVAQIALILILLTPFIRTMVWEMHSWRASYHLSPARMDTVMWGVLVAYVVRSDALLSFMAKCRGWIDVTIIALAILIATDSFGLLSASYLRTPSTHAMGLFISTLRYSALAMMYGLIILRLFIPGADWMKSAFSNKILGKVGLVSYAAYMYHQFFNYTVHFIFRDSFTPALTEWGQFYIPIAVLVSTFVAAAISYRYMERPIQIWARKMPYARSPSSTVSTAATATV